MSLMNFFGNFFKYSQNFNQPGLPEKIQKAIDWECSAVAGSYALHQFTGETNWQPKDVDIMVACKDKEEFLAASKKFEKVSNAVLTKFAWFDSKNGSLENKEDDELFHESVLGSRTYIIYGFDKSIQLICLQKTETLRSPSEILSKTSDIPACVSYTMCENEKIFHIPERGREILLTKRGKKENICESRYDKYLKRGYQFY